MRDVLCDSLYSSPQWALLINPFERCGDFLRVCEIRSQTSIFSLFLGKTKKNTFLKLLSASWMCGLLLLFFKGNLLFRYASSTFGSYLFAFL